MTSEDIADIEESVNGYLLEVGLPPAPFTWWEVAPPDGMSGAAFRERLERACLHRVTATSGADVARQHAAVLTEEVRAIFAPDPMEA